MSPSIAVVIATCHRPHLLRRCLEALAEQSIPVTSYEIVVVDDGPSEATRQVVMAFNAAHHQAPTCHYLQARGTKGPAGARNRGWRATQAPLIAFTDDDTEPTCNWLYEGSRCMTHKVAAVGGQIEVPTSAAPTDHERNTQGLETAEFATANAFVWRRALETVGGFDERFTRAWREDSDLHFELLQHCGPVRWAPLAVVRHPVREVPWGFSLKQQANVFFDALLYKKHPRLYRLKIMPHPPWRYYLIVGCIVGALISAVFHVRGLTLSLLALAFAGYIDFCVLRLHGTSRSPVHIAEMLLTSLLIPFLALYWRIRGALHFRVLFL